MTQSRLKEGNNKDQCKSNVVENGKTAEKVNEPKVQLLEKMNKTDEALFRLANKKRKNRIY